MCSRVVRAKNLFNFGTCNEILNLFSCFGDVKKIQFLHNQNYAFIEFCSVKQAMQTVENLNKIKIEGKTLHLDFSKNH